MVYVGCDDEHLYALNGATGKVAWRYKTNGFVQSSPAVIGDTVYIGDDDGGVHAVDRKTGQARWTHATEGQIISSANHHDAAAFQFMVFACGAVAPPMSEIKFPRSSISARPWE